MTNEPESLVPIKSVEFEPEGEFGNVPVNTGTAGGVLSSVKLTEVIEHAPTLPASSVALAQRVIVTLSNTVNIMLNAPDCATPLPKTVPVQVLFKYNLTVEFDSAVPDTIGLLSLATAAGLTPVKTGRPGAVLSLM